MNGLVYFDQFSLIPPVHLGLVILGIFVLLGGVWVVSIHSGGRGVDVGTWNESEDFSREESILLPDSEDPRGNIGEVAAGVSMTEQPVCKTTDRQARPVEMERQTLSESDIPRAATFPETTGSELNDPTRDPGLDPIPTTENRRPRAHSQLYSSPQRPSLRHSSRRRLATDVCRSPTSVHSGNSRTVSHHHSSYSQAPPLGPVSTLGTGFQIGLSPLSPGFAIVPLDRRRRTSSLGVTGRPSLADVVNEIITGLRLRETEERRTDSEDEVTRVPSNGVQDVSRNNGAALGEEHVESDMDATRGRRRWRWIRKVFIRKD